MLQSVLPIILFFFLNVKLCGGFCTRSQVFLYIFDTLTDIYSPLRDLSQTLHADASRKKRTRRGKSASLFIKKSAQPSGRSAEKTDSDTAEQTCQKAGGVKSLSCFVLPTSRQKPGRPAYPHEKPKSLNQGVGFIQEPHLNALRRNFLFFYSRTHTVSVNGSDPENVNPRKECRNRKDPRCRLSLQKV